ncbi:hypothetical protein bthur0013_66290 [Bacillus thuringiensis IBL 200]|nr:hypothetical protein bthur0013_66290 [Bacillus thuringiensis IBL 200]
MRSHPHFNENIRQANFLLQMNGNMKDDEFNKYKEVMNKVVK